MSDEEQRRGDAARGGSQPDETRPFEPIVGSGNQPDGGPRSDDAWVLDGPDQSDRTAQLPRADGGPGSAETVPARRADATSVMPAVEDGPGAGQAWSGRAEVRPPLPVGAGDTAAGGWDAVPPPTEPRGRWWTPIVVGIAVLLLLALLGWGVWLIVQNGSTGDGSPAPAVSTTAAEPTTKPTTTPPTTEPTTTPPTTEPTGPEAVTIPALKGLSSAEARRALDRTGLAYRLRSVTSDDAPAGTVLDSDPGEGQQVPPDTTVTLIIAAAPTTAPTTPSTPASTGDQPDDN